MPDATLERWFAPLSNRLVRRDLAKYAGGARVGRRHMLAATTALGSFERPVLVAWAREDRLMPLRLGRRLAADFPNSRLIEIDDSYTLVPWDQPEKLVAELRPFILDAGRPTLGDG